MYKDDAKPINDDCEAHNDDDVNLPDYIFHGHEGGNDNVP